MEKNVDEQAVARNAARGALRAEREARRAAMEVARDLSGGQRLARRVSSVLIEQEIFDDSVRERGGDEGFLRWVCAQAASGVPAVVLCEEYGWQMGVLGSWLSEVPERLEAYRRAQAWAAEGLVGEALEEAWGDGFDVVRSKLRVDTNLRVAGKWNRAVYGEEKQQAAGGVPVINFVMGGGVTVEQEP